MTLSMSFSINKKLLNNVSMHLALLSDQISKYLSLHHHGVPILYSKILCTCILHFTETVKPQYADWSSANTYEPVS